MVSWRGCGMKSREPNFEDYPTICLEGLRKSTKKSQDSFYRTDIWTHDL